MTYAAVSPTCDLCNDTGRVTVEQRGPFAVVAECQCVASRVPGTPPDMTAPEPDGSTPETGEASGVVDPIQSLAATLMRSAFAGDPVGARALGRELVAMADDEQARRDDAESRRAEAEWARRMAGIVERFERRQDYLNEKGL